MTKDELNKIFRDAYSIVDETPSESLRKIIIDRLLIEFETRIKDAYNQGILDEMMRSKSCIQK